MYKRLLMVCICAVVGASVLPHATAAAPTSKTRQLARLNILRANLLSSVEQPDGTVQVLETSAIKYVVNKSCYHWVLKFTPVTQLVRVTEELVLPASAKNWDNAEGTKVRKDRSSAISQREADGNSGVIGNGWCIAEGDPVGKYSIIIRQGQRMLHRFVFTVGETI